MSQIPHEISRIDLHKVADFLPYPFIIAEIIDGIHLNTHLNLKFSEEIGYTYEEIPTIETWYEHAYPDAVYRQEVIDRWNEEELESLLEGKVSLKKKSLVTRKDGSKRWYEIKATVIGKVHVVAFVDLDKEIALQEALKNTNLNNDRMLSILGHDLRGPVANLMTISSLAVNADVTADEFTEVIQQINLKSTDVLDLIDNTMQWAKMNFNDIRINSSEIDWNALLQTILSVYESAIENKKIKVIVQTSEMGKIVSDVEILTIIIRNLLSNAIKFTPEKGSITITAANNELVVKDTGIGMPESKVASLFSQQHAASKGTNNEPGTGLGLQLIVTLVEKIGCRLEVESIESIGTTMRLKF